MKLIALETTDRQGAVAAFEQGEFLLELPLAPSQRSAQSLAPGMQRLLQEVGWQPEQVQVVAVAVGPGSFTGLRVGVTTAKVFAYATGAEVVAVNSLEAIAAGVPEVTAVSVGMDAGRGEVYAADFTRMPPPDDSQPPAEVRIVPALQWMQAAAELGLSLAGPALERWGAQAPDAALLIPAELGKITATAIGNVAWARYQAGQRDDVWRLSPRYYRRSAAEETWDLKQQQHRAP